MIDFSILFTERYTITFISLVNEYTFLYYLAISYDVLGTILMTLSKSVQTNFKDYLP